VVSKPGGNVQDIKPRVFYSDYSGYSEVFKRSNLVVLRKTTLFYKLIQKNSENQLLYVNLGFARDGSRRYQRHEQNYVEPHITVRGKPQVSPSPFSASA
jgi:hypothetical protein